MQSAYIKIRACEIFAQDFVYKLKWEVIDDSTRYGSKMMFIHAATHIVRTIDPEI
jgi:hypothetical protein